MDLESTIEAILFYTGEPASTAWLAKVTGAEEGAVWSALRTLEEKLKGRGLRVVYKDSSVALGTAPEAGPLIEKIAKEELEKDLGKAALETLTIVLYQGPVMKSKIDYIRGVNSGFILRSLLVRGLVEREVNPEDERSFLYRPTLQLFSFLGITRREELPEYGVVSHEIKKFEAEFEPNKEGNS